MGILEFFFGYYAGMFIAFPVVLVLGVFVTAWGRK